MHWLVTNRELSARTGLTVEVLEIIGDAEAWPAVFGCPISRTPPWLRPLPCH